MVELNTTADDRYSRPFFEGFIMSTIVCFLPFKPLGYLQPLIFIVWFTVRSNSGRTLFNIIRLNLLFALVICGYTLVYALLNEHFIVQNAILAMITYGALLAVFVIPAHLDLMGTKFLSYIKVMKVIIVIESLLGISQVVLYVVISGASFDTSAGDIAEGTLSPLSFLNPSLNFNNQIFTNNLLLLLLFYAPYAIAMKRGYWIAALAFLAVIMASVWHMLLTFMLATALVTIFFSRSFFKLSGQRILIVFFLVAASVFTVLLQPTNFRLIRSYYRKAIKSESPKVQVTEQSIYELPSDFPWVYGIGLGPGQYSSKAGLIGSGKYFGSFKEPKKVPFVTPTQSRAFEKYTYPLWDEVATRPGIYGDSTMARPFYSVLSILIEFGFLAFVLLLWLVFRFFKKLKRDYRLALEQQDQMKAFYALACGIAVAYFAMISMFENYLEAAHAIFIGILLTRCFYSYVKANGTVPIPPVMKS